MAGHRNKTHKGLKKRVKVTRNGKVVRGTAGNRKLATTKNGKRKRRLRKRKLLLNPAMAVTFAKVMKLYRPGRNSKKRAEELEARAAAKVGAATATAGAGAEPAKA